MVITGLEPHLFQIFFWFFNWFTSFNPIFIKDFGYLLFWANLIFALLWGRLSCFVVCRSLIIWLLILTSNFFVLFHTHNTPVYTHPPWPHLTHYFNGNLGALSLGIPYHTCNATKVATILDKTVEKIVYLGSTFPNTVAVLFLPTPPSPESNVVVYSKESLIPGCF